jgi:hypothetical protein
MRSKATRADRSDSRDTTDASNPPRLDKVERLDASNDGTPEEDLTTAERLSATLEDLELETFERGEELHCRKEVRSDEVHAKVPASRGNAPKLDDELLLSPDAELREGLEEVADRPRGRAVMLDGAAEQDSWPKEERSSSVRYFKVGAISELGEEPKERDLVV